MKRLFSEPAALLILLAIVGLRPLISESFHTSQVNVPFGMQEIEDPCTYSTLILNLIILLITTGITANRIIKHCRPSIPTGLKIGVVVLSAAMALSCYFAAEKQPAINASIDLFAALALCLALVQLLDKTWKIRLTLCVVAASGLANVAECADQYFVSFDETQQWYNELQDHNQTGQHDQPGPSFNKELLEQRMLSHEASGYFAHSNVAGGYLLLTAFAAIAVTVCAVYSKNAGRKTNQIAVGILVISAILFATVLTKGLGTIMAGFAGIILLASRVLKPDFYTKKPKRTFRTGWICICAAICVFTVWGITHDGFPHPSIDFRWDYWTASAKMFTDNWLTGVGAENFGDYYLQYKPITSPEEVKNPHNFLVQIASEYGFAGLAGLIVILLYTTELLICSPVISKPQSEHDLPKNRIYTYAAALALLVFLPRILFLPSQNPAFVIWTTTIAGIPWLTGFALIWLASRSPCTENDRLITWSTVLCGGLLAFLLQDTINFALFVPGARTTFFAVLAIPIAMRQSGQPEDGTRRFSFGPFCTPIALFVIAIFTTVACLGPQIQTQKNLQAARNNSKFLPTGSITMHPCYLAYTNAARNRLDATPPSELSKWLLVMSHSLLANHPNQAYETATLGLHTTDQAIARAPRKFTLWQQKALFHSFIAQLSGKANEHQHAINAMNQAIKLYPARPKGYVTLGDLYFTTNVCSDLKNAIQQWNGALELDDSRPAWERFRRFTERERSEIKLRIENAMSLLNAGSCIKN